MGMYDSLFVKCKVCGDEVEFQSKAGECLLNRYTVENVPPAIAADLDGVALPCPECDEIIKIKSIVIIATMGEIK